MLKSSRRKYNIHDAKTHLSKLIEYVEDGEEVIIARAGVPVARLVPMVAAKTGRTLGTEVGRVIIAEDFDAPLPNRILKTFET